MLVFDHTDPPTVELDPHFAKGKASPIARFKPTTKGIKLAHMVAQYLSSEN